MQRLTLTTLLIALLASAAVGASENSDRESSRERELRKRVEALEQNVAELRIIQVNSRKEIRQLQGEVKFAHERIDALQAALAGATAKLQALEVWAEAFYQWTVRYNWK